MSKKHHPLTHKEVVSVLRAFDFKKYPQDGTSHIHWKKRTTDAKGRSGLWKVTVDEPKAPFSHDLVTFMARQAGLSKREFYKVATDKRHRKSILEKMRGTNEL